MMNSAIITIGNELLNGTTIDTNSAWISDRLWRIGVTTKKIVTIGDQNQAIKGALDECLREFDIVILTGGLGPTNDDITKKSIAEYFKVMLKEDKTLRSRIENLFANRGVPMPAINLEQALIPETAKIIPNPIGTAAGFYFDQADKISIILPGVPAEMKRMMSETIFPLLKEKYEPVLGCVFYRVIRTTGIYESKLQELLIPLQDLLKEVSLASLPHRYGVDLRLGTYAKSNETAKLKLDKAQNLILEKITPFVYEIGERDLSDVVAGHLNHKKFSIAVAESCTGGLIQHLLTNIPGSSNFFRGGIVAYENAVKQEFLGVREETLSTYGAVSMQTAKEMVLGIQQKTSSDCAVSTTGIAGPDGGTIEKPVGLVYIGCAVKNKLVVRKFIFHKERMINKYRFAYAALNLLRQKLA